MEHGVQICFGTPCFFFAVMACIPMRNVVRYITYAQMYVSDVQKEG